MMNVLGIDLAKRTFDVTLLSEDGQRRHQQFPNNLNGFDKLLRWLNKLSLSELHACMEATNVYWEAMALFLFQQGYTVSVVNPARIKGFAMSKMQRNKTDKLDSFIIASFCRQGEPDAWTPPTDAQRKMRALVRHRDDLIQTRIQQHNRLSDTTDSAVRESLGRLLELIEAQLKEVEQQIKQLLAEHEELGSKVALMTAVVGIGAVTAYKLLGEFYDLESFKSAKAAAADAGLTPAQYESGTSVKRRTKMSKVGKAGVRAALYWPAITAMSHCPAFKQFAARLAARGKAKGVIIGAVMRKLLHIVYGVLKHKTAYDPNKVLGSSALPT
jgi:transposase